jgi:Rrf2 family protein
MQIMTYLTRNRKIISSSELSKNLLISRRYTLQVTSKLRNGGFINAYPGMSGGYTLSMDASKISFYSVIELMEGDMSIPACLSRPLNCDAPCMSSNLLNTVNVMKDIIDEYLKTITFDKVAEMDTSGHLSDVLRQVEQHLETLQQ